MKPKKQQTPPRTRRPRIALQKQIDKLSDKEKFCLDGYFLNADMRGAYLYSREKESEATEDSLKVQSKKWFSSEPVKAYVELNGFKAKVLKDSSEKEVSEADAIFDRVADLLDGFTLNADPRIAIQAADKLANLYQLKTKPAEEQEKRKHYYLPLRCEDCAIYKYVRDNGIKLKPNN